LGEHWREFGFWRWWWRERVPIDVKVLAGLLAAAIAFGAGGYLAWSLPGAEASSPVADVHVETVEKVVTVREPGRVVRRVVPVVQRVFVRGKSATQTRLQATTIIQDGKRVVTTEVVRPVRVLERQVVTVGAKTRTRTVVRILPGVARTVTGERVTTVVTRPRAVRTVTDQRMTTAVQTVTAQQPVTTVVRTATEQQSVTSVRTVTSEQPTVTSTRTVTSVQPTTVVQTTTQTVTTTEPTITVTTSVTVTVPPGKPG
jgi:hypothetical protein